MLSEEKYQNEDCCLDAQECEPQASRAFLAHTSVAGGAILRLNVSVRSWPRGSAHVYKTAASSTAWRVHGAGPAYFLRGHNLACISKSSPWFWDALDSISEL